MQIDPETARQIGKLRAELSAEIEAVQAHLVSGRCASFDEYRHSVGRLHGLSRAAELVAVYLVKPTESDD